MLQSSPGKLNNTSLFNTGVEKKKAVMSVRDLDNPPQNPLPTPQ